jgi:competence protein ComEC
MSSVPDSPASAPRPERQPSIWRSPLVWVALAVTAGIVLDRHWLIPLPASLSGAAAFVLAWLIARWGGWPGLGLIYLLLAWLCAGAAYHHDHCHVYPPDDVGFLAPLEPHPVRVRGLVEEEPQRLPAPPSDPLRSREMGESSAGILALQQIHVDGAWQPLSGRVRLLTPGGLPAIHAGDEVELAGQLQRLLPAVNPGGFDSERYWRNARVRARLTIRQTTDALTIHQRGWMTSPAGWIGVVRAWGQQALSQALPERTRGVACALLLGEGAPMTRADWNRYIHTGIIHVLAISGQHLVILGAGLWFLLRVLGVRQRSGALFVTIILVSYALLTGGRPPALRAAVTTAALCGGLLLRRPTLASNLFALAWLVVILVNPTDVFDQGCQLSFLAVVVLYWGTGGLLTPSTDPLDRLVEQTRTWWERLLRWAVHEVVLAYLVAGLVWVAISPLVAYHTHLIAPAALPLGPPVSLLATFALFFGFAALLLSVIHPILALPFASAVHYLLLGCEGLVDLAERFSSHRSVPDVPLWWLAIFYLGLLAALTQAPLRARWGWCLVAGLAWLCLGLGTGLFSTPPEGLRCTFLAVGHGGCAVLETPDGRTLLYDAGAINGPEVAQRHIVPYLQHRGIRRVDEVFLSHADLDHFNGLIGLLDALPVGQVTRTPSFPDKDNKAIRHTLAELERRGIPVRVTKAGDRFRAGPVTLDVLHPPARGPDGNENTRSLVLLVRHEDLAILLTGDLEGAGLERVIELPGWAVNVLQAPHHGSHRVDGAALARWCAPELVVSCQGAPRGAARAPALYSREGAAFWSTHDHGAITLSSAGGELCAATFLTRQLLVLHSGVEE